MALLEDLAALMRPLDATEKRMFGGVGFMLNGNLAVCIHKGSLLVRVGEGAMPDALRQSGAARMVMSGRAMKGWVVVAPEGLASTAALASWVDRAQAFTATLPAKPAGRKPSRKRG